MTDFLVNNFLGWNTGELFGTAAHTDLVDYMYTWGGASSFTKTFISQPVEFNGINSLYRIP